MQAALEALPEPFVLHDCTLWTGIKHVFPGYHGGPDPAHQVHDPVAHFPVGEVIAMVIAWYQFMPTSTDQRMMDTDQFCGQALGPRTIYKIRAERAYTIFKIRAERAYSTSSTFPTLVRLRQRACYLLSTT